MTKQPEVLQKSTSEHEATLKLSIPEDLVYTDGHFESDPIVPGVVLVDWMFDRARNCLPDLPLPDEINQVKFRKPLQPGDRCTLRLTRDPDERKLSFEYVDGDTTYATGWYTFENDGTEE